MKRDVRKKLEKYMSLIAHRFEYVEFGKFLLLFSSDNHSWKNQNKYSIFWILNLTRQNWWASKDIEVKEKNVDITSVPLKKIVTCICNWLIAPFLWFFWHYSYFILQIHHAKSFKMSHITHLYCSYLSRYSLIQIQVTIFLSGTDVTT